MTSSAGLTRTQLLFEIAHEAKIPLEDLRRVVAHGYTHRQIPRRHGRLRKLSLPTEAMAAVLQALAPYLLEIPVHRAAHGFVRGRSQVTAASVHCASHAVVNFDLADWYENVTADKLEPTLLAAGWSPAAASVVIMLATEDGHLPQGACTSPALANAAALPLDVRLAACAARWRFQYSRFADDLTFSTRMHKDCRRRIQALRRSVLAAVRASGFEINRTKVRVAFQHQRQQVVGLVVNGAAAPRAPREYIRRVRAALHNLDRCRPVEWSFQKLRGAIAFLQMTDPEKGAAFLRKFRAIRAKYRACGLEV